MANLGSVSVSVDANIAGFESDMGRAARVAEREFKKIEREAAKARENVTASMIAVGTAAGRFLGDAIAGIARSIPGVIDHMDNLSKAAQKVGLPTEDFSKLTYAAGLADVSMETLVGSLGKLTKSQAAALNSTSQQAQVFEALGIAVTDASGNLRESDDVLADFADRFQSLKGSPEAMAAGFALFGRSFQDLIPLLKDGGDGIRAAGDELESFGGVLSTKAGQQAEAFNDNLTRLKTVAEGLAISFASQVLPEMVRLSENLVKAATDGDTASEATDSLKASFEAVISISGSVVSSLESIAGLMDTLGVKSMDASEQIRQLAQDAAALAAIPSSIAAYAEMAITGSEEAEVRFRKEREKVRLGFTGEKPRTGNSGVASPDYLQMPGYLTGKQSFSAIGFSAIDYANAKVDKGKLRSALGGGGAASRKSGKSSAAVKDRKEEITELEAIEAEWTQQTIDASNRQAEAWVKSQDEIADAIKRKEEAIASNIKRADEQIADMQFELALIGMTNAEREREIALRYAGADATEAQRAQIIGLTDAMRAASEQAAFIEEIKASMADMFVDFVSGAKSAKEAFGDFADQLFARALQFVADKAINAMFEAFSNKGSSGGGAAASGGSGGGGWGSIISSVISAWGGGRAAGGPVMGGNFYEVGEQNRPEMFRSRGKSYLIPGNDGAVMPMRSGGGVQQVNHFNYAAPYDARTESQKNGRLAFETSRAMARNR